MPYCPAPGPPCYTENSSETGASANFQSNAFIQTRRATSIAWKRKYFNNPIVSAKRIEARIYDVNKSKVLVEFREHKSEHALTGSYFLYTPDDLKNLEGHSIVVYELKEEGETLEFKIQIR